MIPRRHPLAVAAAAVACLLALAACASIPSRAMARTTPVRIVTIGDSIMAGNGLADGEDWADVLADEDGLDLVNLACSGAGFTVAGSCGADYAGLIPKAVAAQPTLVIIQSSSNDIDATPDEIQSATATTVAALHAALPHAHLIGLSTIWNDHSDLPSEIAVSSDALHSVLRQQGGRYIDVGQPLQGHPEWMQSDDVHPTLTGQEAILQAVRSALLPRLPRV